MESITNLKPERVFHYFNEISKIPHGSGNTKQISDFCVEFAKAHNLKYIQDELNNIIIKKCAQHTECEKTVIIQGHLDMVCEKEENCNIDFLKDSLNLYVDGDYVKARGTTLGGDDGIAISYALAVLENKDIVHPNIEAVFTVDEEIGLIGAGAIDLSSLKGNILLNIDSEAEGTFTVSCAGGATVKCTLPLEFTETDGIKYTVKISGLLGGHSGVEIDKYRANSNILASRLLYTLSSLYDIRLVKIEGGLKDNAIPNLTVLEFVASQNVENDISTFEKEIKDEFRAAEKNLSVTVNKEKTKASVLSYKDTLKIAQVLVAQPNGVMNMELEIPGLVKTSLNMGILKTDNEKIEFSYSVRSSKKSEKKALIDKLKAVMELSGGNAEISGEYSPWEYRSETYLRERVAEVYKKLYGKEPKFEAIHAGLECGVLAEKIDDLDAVSFGPDMPDIHTPKERLSISSAKRVWEFIVAMLEDISKN